MLLAVVMSLFACADIAPPTVQMFDATLDDQIIASVEPSRTSDTTFPDNLPGDTLFDITFSEPMDLVSATEHIWVEDAYGELVEADIEGRLDVITVVPVELLEPNSNHILHVDNGMIDASRWSTEPAESARC